VAKGASYEKPARTHVEISGLRQLPVLEPADAVHAIRFQDDEHQTKNLLKTYRRLLNFKTENYVSI